MTPQERLVEAKAALHAIMIGGGVRVVVDQNGERVEYTPANRQALITYIAMLEAEIANGGSTQRVGPIRFFF